MKPTPPSPIVRPRNVKPRRTANVSSAAVTYSATLLALHPAAEHHRIPARSNQGMSIWSVPMVAVPTKRIRLPSNNSRLTRVVDRIASRSASRTASAVKWRPSHTRASPSVPNASNTNGMFVEQMIFMNAYCCSVRVRSGGSKPS